MARRPDTALGHALAAGRELTGPFVTELAHDGDPVARWIGLGGRVLGRRAPSIVNMLNPEVIVIGGGVIAAGEMLLGPARAEMRARALAPVARRRARGRRLLRRGGGDDRGGLAGAREAGGSGMSGRLVVCPTPIGNLEDITLRVLSALRDADVVACEDTRRTRVLLDRYGVSATLVPTTSTTSGSGRRPRGPDERRGRGRAGERCGDAARQRSGLRAGAGCVAAGLEVEVLPGPSAALAALVASALPADVWRFVGFLPRKRAGAGGVSRRPTPWSRSSRRGGWRLPWRSWRSWMLRARSRSAGS